MPSSSGNSRRDRSDNGSGNQQSSRSQHTQEIVFHDAADEGRYWHTMWPERTALPDYPEHLRRYQIYRDSQRAVPEAWNNTPELQTKQHYARLVDWAQIASLRAIRENIPFSTAWRRVNREAKEDEQEEVREFQAEQAERRRREPEEREERRIRQMHRRLFGNEPNLLRRGSDSDSHTSSQTGRTGRADREMRSARTAELYARTVGGSSRRRQPPSDSDSNRGRF